MKIYTKRGDFGKTDLRCGKRVKKHDRLVCSYGTIDELNSFLGLAKAFSNNDQVKSTIEQVQKKLFKLGTDLATSLNTGCERVSQNDVMELEKLIDSYEHDVTSFVIPGATKPNAFLHVARTVCRRAERIVSTARTNPEVLRYLNRLSDLLFVLAKVEEKQ